MTLAFYLKEFMSTRIFGLYKYVQDNKYVITGDLPGVDPKDVKISFFKKEVYLNDQSLGAVGDRFDLTKATAELKFGVLKIVVPEDPSSRGDIPLVTN